MGESRKRRSWRRCYEKGIAQFKIYCYNTHIDPAGYVILS